MAKANNSVTALKKERDDAITTKAKVHKEIKGLSTKVSKLEDDLKKV